MTIERGYRTELTVEDVTVDRRDVELLEAIDRRGSMHAAADDLGRSYARLQRRVVELEEVLGDLTERRRGGSGGGGTDLTATARDLLRQFERHRTELDGVARVTESVVEGRVVDRSGELATVETPAGQIVALAPPEATAVQVGVRSDAVVLSAPGGSSDERGERTETSFRNRFPGTVTAVDAGESIVRVRVELEGGVELEALITRGSFEGLELGVGKETVASFKATAARAIALSDDRTRDR